MDGFVIVLSHASGAMPAHDQIMLLGPILPLLLIGAVVLANALDARGAFSGHEPMVGVAVPLTAIAAGLSLGSAAIHFAVVESHLSEFAPYGYAFMVTALFQAIWAALYLLRPGQRTAFLGAAVNLGVVTVWLVSRAAGLPFGPEAGVPQPLGVSDLMATSFEIVLIGVLAATLQPSWARRIALRQLPVQKAFVLAAFCIASVIAMTMLALLTQSDEALVALF